MRLEKAECTNEPCGCKRAHRLHWMKEPCLKIIETGEYWSAWCYISFLTMQASSWLSEKVILEEEARADLSKIRWASNRIEHLQKKVHHWKEVFVEYAGHKNDCAISEMAFAGRDVEVKCTCGYNHRLHAIQVDDDGLVDEVYGNPLLDPESSNGRTLVSEANCGGSNPSSGTKRKKKK